MNIHKSLLIFLISSLVSISQSEWTLQYPNSPTSLEKSFFLNDSTGWVIDTKGMIYYTLDSGLSWEKNIVNTDKTPLAIYFYDEENGWIVGRDGLVLHSTNGGKDWLNQNSNVNDVLMSVKFLTKNLGWASGNNNTILKTTDGGNSWIVKYGSEQQLMYADFKSIFPFSENNCIIVGLQSVVKTNDGGETWTKLLEVDWHEQIINGASFIDQTTGWIVGSKTTFTPPVYSQTRGYIYKTTNGGAEWIDQTYDVNSNYNFDIYSVFFIDKDLGWVLGSPNTGIYRTIDGGSTWIPSPYYDYGEIKFFNQSTGLIAGSNRLSKTSDGGINWNAFYEVPFYADLTSLDFVDQNTGFAAGRGGILKTSNGGSDWFLCSGDFNESFNSIFSIDENNIYACGIDVVIKSTDGGDSWLEQEAHLSPREHYHSIFFINKNTGWIVGRNGSVLKTTNGGNNWLQQSWNTEYDLTSVYFYNEYIGWITGRGGVYKTVDGGNSWTNQTGSVSDTRAFFLDNSIGWVFETSGGGKLLKTTNGGGSWLRIIQSDSLFLSFSSSSKLVSKLYFLDQLEGYFVTTTGEIYYSNNGGINWEKDSTENRSTGLNDIYFVDKNNGWAVGYNGYIWHKNYDNASTVENDLLKSKQKSFYLSQNYPNPFNPETNITYHLPAGKNSYNVVIKIYDTLGRLLKVLVNEEQSAGTYSVKWDGKDQSGREVSSGIYIYSVHADHLRVNKKMVLMR